MSLSRNLDLLGAEGLQGQYITIRVRNIDTQKLGQALGGGTKAAFLPTALRTVDLLPKESLNLFMPAVQEKAKTGYGVEFDYQISDAPPKPGAKGFYGAKAFLVGGALGVGGAYAASHFGLVDLVRSAIVSLRARVGV